MNPPGRQKDAFGSVQPAVTPASKPGIAPALWLIPAVYFLFVAGEFAAMTTLALTLTQAGESALAVGTLGSTLWLGLFTASTQAHRLVARFGQPRLVLWATAAATLALGTLALHDHYLGWLAGVLALGLGGGLVWVAGESWLAEIAPAAQRGLFVGLFETSVGLAMIAGPAMLPLALALGVPVLWLALALMGAALVACVVLSWQPAPAHHEEPAMQLDTALAAGKRQPAPLWRRVALPLVAVAAIGGLMESGVSAMLPSISLRLGFEVQTAAWLGAVIGAGSALMQSPFGLLADRAGLPRAMALAWALIIAAAGAMFAGSDDPGRMLWAVGFVLGGVGGAVYTLVVIELGHRLAGSGLVKAMGLLVTGYTGGTAGGPVLGGWLFDVSGLAGLALVLLGFSLVGAALAWRALRGHAPATRALRDAA